MRLPGLKLLPVLAVIAGFGGTPAHAFNWACTAKNSEGTTYEGRMLGLANDWTRQAAGQSAIRKCEGAGGRSCELVECTDLDAKYAIQ